MWLSAAYLFVVFKAGDTLLRNVGKFNFKYENIFKEKYAFISILLSGFAIFLQLNIIVKSIFNWNILKKIK